MVVDTKTNVYRRIITPKGLIISVFHMNYTAEREKTYAL